MLLAMLVIVAASAPPLPTTTAPPTPTDVGAGVRAAAVEGHATLVHAEYAASLEAARRMRAAIAAFCAEPSEAGLARARETWVEARWIYGRTEVFRFGGGPIDTTRGGVETFINAWPVDEAYLDAVEGAAAPGIIANPSRYPALGRVILRQLNQRGGETNVCTGWHAIEFLLWGQDRSEDGPGTRSAADFVDGAPFAERRREFLLEVTDMLCEDLARLEQAWRPGLENYRARFVQDPDAAVRSILAGVRLLAGFEMSGERLAVPYETRDQEEEHSCFSDTTHVDFLSNIAGIAAVLRGRGTPGMIAVIAIADPARARSLDEATSAAVAAVEAMPVPFDRGIRAADGTSERSRLLAAIEALERLGDETAAGARAIGMNLPSEPQG